MLTPEQIQQLVQLPLYGLLIIAIVALWRALLAEQKAHMDDLKKMNSETVTDLRTRIVLLEARMGINDEKNAMKPIPGANLN